RQFGRVGLEEHPVADIHDEILLAAGNRGATAGAESGCEFAVLGRAGRRSERRHDGDGKPGGASGAHDFRHALTPSGCWRSSGLPPRPERETGKAGDGLIVVLDVAERWLSEGSVNLVPAPDVPP